MKEEDYLLDAEDFAKAARRTSRYVVVLQNAFKAVEFAVSAWALKAKKPLPRDHYQSENLAYLISKNFGKKFTELKHLYLGSYKRRDGEDAKRALKLMEEMLNEIKNRIASR
ncbi:MAG: hypothetical protein ACE5J9_00900 [Methanosarcinales archaeon]